MSVKCLNATEKVHIIEWYRDLKSPLSDIADVYMVSPRTIARVIHEAGMATPLSRRTGEAYEVMSILKRHDVTITELGNLLYLGKIAVKNIEDSYKAVPQEEFEDLPF